MNDRETYFAEFFESIDCNILTSGWPDFLVIDQRGNSAFCVEIKQENEELKPNQKIMHQWLNRMGIPVYVARKLEDVKHCVGKQLMTKSQKEEFEYGIEKLENKINDMIKEIQNEFQAELEGMKKCLSVLTVTFDETEHGLCYETLDMLSKKTSSSPAKLLFSKSKRQINKDKHNDAMQTILRSNHQYQNEINKKAE